MIVNSRVTIDPTSTFRRIFILARLKISVYLVVILLTGSIVAKAIGSLLPEVDHPTLRGFTEGCEDKLPPCWYGILLGRTTIDEALSVMDKMGYPVEVAERWEYDFIFRGVGEPEFTVQFNPYFEDGRVMFMYLRDLETLQLIDVFDFFGLPTHFELSYFNDYLVYPSYMQIILDGRLNGRLSQNLNEITFGVAFPPPTGLKWEAHLRRNDYCAIQMERGGLPC